MLSKQDLDQIKGVVEIGSLAAIKQELKPVKEDLKTIKEDIEKIRTDQKNIINFFDHSYLDLRKRIEKIEEVLNLSVKT